MIPPLTKTCRTNFVVHFRDASTVWICHPMSYHSWEENSCLLLGVVCSLEGSVYGGTTGGHCIKSKFDAKSHFG